MVTNVGYGSGASYALGNLAVYTRVGGAVKADSLNINIESNTGTDDSTADNSAAVLNYDFLNSQRSAALSQLSVAKKINDQAINDISNIKDLLTDMQSEVTQLAPLIGKDDETSTSARETLLDNINLIAEKINQEIARSTHQNEAILGGTYSQDGQLTFKTSLFGSDLTTLPHFFSFKAEDEQLTLGTLSDDAPFSVEVNGATLTADATDNELNAFSEQINKALSQTDAMDARARDRSLFLNLRTSSITATDIEPMSYEQRTPSKTQQILQGLIPSNSELLHLNGQIISIIVQPQPTA